MLFTADYIAYQQTGFFSKMVLDYLNGTENIQAFYAQCPTLEGIKETVIQKGQQNVNRTLLVTELQKQYSQVAAPQMVLKNIELLAAANTFTVCTAHQPNLFT